MGMYSAGGIVPTVIGRETTRSKERPEGSTWKSSLYWTLMMLQGPARFVGGSDGTLIVTPSHMSWQPGPIRPRLISATTLCSVLFFCEVR